MDTSNNKKVPDQVQVSVRLRHNRFDGFDIYTAEVPGRDKLLFHKETHKKLIIADTYKFLGVNNNLWLCENIKDKTINIAPFDKFTELQNSK
jgi:hypothetical protein